MNPYRILLLLHVLCMVSAVGSLAYSLIALPAGSDNSKRGFRFVSLLVTVGTLAGLGLFMVLMDGVNHAVVGTKILLLLAAGAFLGMGSAKIKKEQFAKARGMRWGAFVSLLVAALLGFILL